MKAVVHTVYGPPETQQILDVEKPVPKSKEVLVKVHATTVNRTDCGLRSANYVISRLFTGLLKPRHTIGGSEFAGTVEAVGSRVTEFTVGDKVFGFNDTTMGAHAEYMATPAKGAITTMPKDMDFVDAAPIAEAAQYALNNIRSANVAKGQHVLVYGASGAIGSAAVQIAKHLGAHVTAVIGTKHVDLAKHLGAEVVVDYQTEDFTALPQKFDFIFDAVGKSSYGACKKLLKPNGIYCSTELGPGGQNPFLALWFAFTGSRKVIFPIPKASKEKVEYLKSLVEAGAFTPVIDKTYPIGQIVQATRYVETGQKTGNVVILVVPKD